NQDSQTEYAFLASGTYSVEWCMLAPLSNDPLQVQWSLAARGISDPQDPIPFDPTGLGTGLGSGTGTGSGSGSGSGGDSGSGSASAGSCGVAYVPPISSPVAG